MGDAHPSGHAWDVAINDTFAGALRHYRKLAAMSQEDLASAASLDRTYISQLERGRKSPTLTTLARLAACLDLTVQQLLREPPPRTAQGWPRTIWCGTPAALWS